MSHSTLVEITNIEELKSIHNYLQEHSNKSSIYIIYFIHNLIRWREKLSQIDFPFNNLKIYSSDFTLNVTFVIVDVTKKFAAQVLWLYSTNDNESFDCLQQLSLINWNEEILFGALYQKNIEKIREFIKFKLCRAPVDDDICCTYYIPKENVKMWNEIM